MTVSRLSLDRFFCWFYIVYQVAGLELVGLGSRYPQSHGKD
jgi:hypothetical protein